MPSRIPSGELTQAIWNCDLPQFQKLIAAGVDVNKPAGRWKMYAFHTPLGAAVSHASTVIDENAIETNRACVEAGWTKPRDHQAERRVALEMVRLLLNAGANPDKPSPSRPPLHLAAHRGDLEAVQLLLAAGADPEGICTSIASSLSRREGRKFIEGYYDAALHCAAEKGHLEVVKALLAAGANPVRPDHTGATPAEVAITNNRHEVFELLKPLTYPSHAG